jgi:C-terminal processing protease CtpA/Prc
VDDDDIVEGEATPDAFDEVETRIDEAAAAGTPDDQLRKLRNELKALRVRTKESEALAANAFEARFADVQDLVPSSLTPKERWDFAEKIQQRFGAQQQQTQTEQATVTEAQEAPTPQELTIAAVAKGSEGNPSPSAGMSPEEALALAKNNPDEYLRLKRSGAVSLERLPGASQ